MDSWMQRFPRAPSPAILGLSPRYKTLHRSRFLTPAASQRPPSCRRSIKISTSGAGPAFSRKSAKARPCRRPPPVAARLITTFVRAHCNLTPNHAPGTRPAYSAQASHREIVCARPRHIIDADCIAPPRTAPQKFHLVANRRRRWHRLFKIRSSSNPSRPAPTTRPPASPPTITSPANAYVIRAGRPSAITQPAARRFINSQRGAMKVCP